MYNNYIIIIRRTISKLKDKANLNFNKRRVCKLVSAEVRYDHATFEQ